MLVGSIMSKAGSFSSVKRNLPMLFLVKIPSGHLRKTRINWWLSLNQCFSKLATRQKMHWSRHLKARVLKNSQFRLMATACLLRWRWVINDSWFVSLFNILYLYYCFKLLLAMHSWFAPSNKFWVADSRHWREVDYIGILQFQDWEIQDAMLISVLQWADIRHPLAAEIIRGFVKNLTRPAVATLEHWARELRRKVLDLIESDLEQMASCFCSRGPCSSFDCASTIHFMVSLLCWVGLCLDNGKCTRTWQMTHHGHNNMWRNIIKNM